MAVLRSSFFNIRFDFDMQGLETRGCTTRQAVTESADAFAAISSSDNDSGFGDPIAWIRALKGFTTCM